jgi:hypothetical protein
VFFFSLQKHCNGKLLVLNYSTRWIPCGIARRHDRAIEHFCCYYLLKGPNDVFLSLGQPREFAKHWGTNQRKWGMSVFAVIIGGFTLDVL